MSKLKTLEQRYHAAEARVTALRERYADASLAAQEYLDAYLDERDRQAERHSRVDCYHHHNGPLPCPDQTDDSH